jgi:hypothetical protein
MIASGGCVRDRATTRMPHSVDVLVKLAPVFDALT